jgi:uncharacterized membrane protein AbrB (regulator of aidB expression)
MTFIKRAVKRYGDLWELHFPTVAMRFSLALLLAFALVVANGYAGHWLAPAAILLTPLVLLGITALLHTDRPPRWLVPAAVSTALLLCLHDAGLTTYGSGDHDAEGRGFSNLYFSAWPARRS